MPRDRDRVWQGSRALCVGSGAPPKGDLDASAAVTSLSAAKAKLKALRDAFWVLAKQCTGRPRTPSTPSATCSRFTIGQKHAFTRVCGAPGFRAPDPMVLHNTDIGRDNFLVYKTHKMKSATGRQVSDPSPRPRLRRRSLNRVMCATRSRRSIRRDSFGGNFQGGGSRPCQIPARRCLLIAAGLSHFPISKAASTLPLRRKAARGAHEEARDSSRENVAYGQPLELPQQRFGCYSPWFDDAVEGNKDASSAAIADIRASMMKKSEQPVAK